MNLKSLLLPLLGLMIGNHFVAAQSTVVDEVIAIVGDKAILRSDVEHQYQQAIMDGTSFKGDAKCKIFEEQLIQKLLLNQAVLDSVEVSENEVVTEVDRRMNYFIQQIGDQKKLEEYFNKSMIQIKREQMDVVRNQMLTQRMQGTITKDIKTLPSEIRLFYRTVNQDSLPMVGTQYEVQQISIYPTVEQKEIDRVKDQLRDFQKQINEGRDFSTLSVLYSEDPGSATRGGDLGWATRSTFVPEFANVAFNLQDKNKVSKIVETEYGFHIIQLIDRKGERINVRHILVKPKVSIKAKDDARLRLDSIRVLVTEKGMPFNEAALRFSMDKDSRANGGLMVNEFNNSSKFEIAHLERMPELARELQKMKDGDYSMPVLTKDKNGKDVYQLYLLKKKTDPHRANLQDDYQVIQNILQAQKRDEAMKSWIREKQHSTYVSIDKAWINCEFEYQGWGK